MKIIVTKNYDELSEKAFEIIKEVVVKNDSPVLGLATGSSPVGLYKLMIEDHKLNNTDYSNVKTYNLDEYIGLEKNHSQSYYRFMHDNLFYGLNVKEKNIHIPVGDSDDLEKSCKEYDELMKDANVDIQVLGIGSNGHIGFNEPGTSFDSLTHVVELKEKTRLDNRRFFNSLEEVPTHAITMGIDTIMHAKKILLVASGLNKAEAIKRMVEGEIGTDCPATVLQNHQDCVVVVDEDAASLLNR